MGAPEVEQRGGVVFRIDGEPWFLPASIATKVIAAPTVARVPGAPPELRGVALVDGNIIPVIELGSATLEREAMLVCTVLGERVGLVGVEIVATGRFEAAGASGEVKTSGETARTFDVTSVIARVREGRWAV